MCILRPMDLISLQECLCSYKKLIEWMPTTSELENDLKTTRLDLIDYLTGQCELALAEDRRRNV